MLTIYFNLISNIFFQAVETDAVVEVDEVEEVVADIETEIENHNKARMFSSFLVFL